MAFAISFALPTYAEGRGWQCAFMHSYFWSGAMQGKWGCIHYLLLTLPNLLMLASPFLLFRLGGDARGLSWLRYSTFAASCLVWSFLILLLADGSGSDLRIGAFMWATSFTLLGLSLMLPPNNGIETVTLRHETFCA